MRWAYRVIETEMAEYTDLRVATRRRMESVDGWAARSEYLVASTARSLVARVG